VELLSRWKELADQLSGEGLRRYDVWPWTFTPHEIVLREPDDSHQLLRGQAHCGSQPVIVGARVSTGSQSVAAQDARPARCRLRQDVSRED
jgi:hypothetical protein